MLSKASRWLVNTFHIKRSGKPMYSVQEFSDITGLPENAIYDLIKKGEIKVLQFEQAGRYRIPKHEVDRFVVK